MLLPVSYENDACVIFVDQNVPPQPFQFKRNVRDEAMGRKDSPEKGRKKAMRAPSREGLKQNTFSAYKGAYEYDQPTPSKSKRYLLRNRAG